jgi:uncharacterized membrane protein YccC
MRTRLHGRVLPDTRGSPRVSSRSSRFGLDDGPSASGPGGARENIGRVKAPSQSAGSRLRSAPAFALGIVREATKLDPSGIELGFGVRCALGVAFPLVLGLESGHALDGVAGAIGALPVGFASRQGAYRSGAAAAFATAAAVSISAFVGAACGGSTVAAVALAALWGFGYGLLASLGPAATVVGVNACVALVIFGQFHDSPGAAAIQAAFVLAGGLVQTLLLVSVWPLARFKRERDVLAAAYRTLAEYAGHFPETRLRAPESAPFAKLSETLADPQPFSSRGEIAAFEALLAEAERIRGTLAALAADRYGFLGHGAPLVRNIRGDATAAGATAADAIGRVGTSSGLVLAEIAAALSEAREPACEDAVWDAFDAPIAALEAAHAEPAVARALGDAEALLGQLRSAWRAATTPAEPSADDGDAAARRPESTRVPRVLRPSAAIEALATLRANLSLRSGFAQHGVRLAIVLGAATLAAHVLPLERGYWVALTAALVLRNDFGSTFTRGVARMLGTLAGAVVASSIALLVRPYPATLLVLAVFFAFAGYVVFNANYALFTLAITGYVIFLLALGGLPEGVALSDRVVETLIGGTLALAAYALWPTWERALVPDRLAEMLEKQRRYAALVLGAYLEPSAASESDMHAAQLASWLARSEAETSVDRMLAEPVRPRAVTARAALGILAASRRFGIAALGLHSRRTRDRVVAPDELGLLASEIDQSFAVLEDALRSRTDPPPLPQLRTAQVELARRIGATSADAATSLATDTDLMVDSVNTIAHLLHRLHANDGAKAPDSNRGAKAPDSNRGAETSGAAPPDGAAADG